MFTDNLGTSSS